VPDKSTFHLELDKELEGGWRWLVKGRPLWLIQRQAGDEGSIVLLEGDAPVGPKTGGRDVNLGQSLDDFWVGQHGATDHQSQLKPNIYLDRYLVMASVAARNIAIYDLETDKVLRILKDVPQPDLISGVVLSDDARHLIQVCSDGQYFIFEVASGRQVLGGRMVDDEIIAYTPQGYYWSTYEGAHFVELRFPGLPGVFPFEQFASVLDRPDIIKASLKEGAGDPPAPKLWPPPRLDMTLIASTTDKTFHVHVSARGAIPLKRLSFYADGQRIYDFGVTSNTLDQDFAVPSKIEARWFTAQVIDANGLVSAPQSIRRPPAAQPTRELHAVLVGNDLYKNPKLHLNYARHDAERLGAALKTLPSQFYARSTVSVLADTAATPEAIRSEIKKAVDTAKVGDTVVFAFAGHGGQNKQGAYYLTPYGFDTARVADTALAWREIASLLHAAKARVIVILDACHAGLSGTEGLSTNDEAVSALLSGEHPPMLVLAASKGRQLSFEGQDWDGGVFTYALIEALEAKRAEYDVDGDGAIEVSELYRALRTILARETKGEQSPWLVRQDLLGDFVVF
jgi:Caspase domain